jgi:hypothetical protein
MQCVQVAAQVLAEGSVASAREHTVLAKASSSNSPSDCRKGPGC